MNNFELDELRIPATAPQETTPSLITIGTQEHIGDAQHFDLNLHLIQSGWDRVCASCPPHLVVRSILDPPEVLPLPGDSGYLALTSFRHRRPTPRFSWTATTKYVHQPTGHHVRLFYGRSTRFTPHLFVILRPGNGQVFSSPILLLLLNALSRALEMPLMLSSVEIAADFAAFPMDARRLASELWVPRIPGHRYVGDAASPTFYRGAPSSSFQTKVYWKQEGDLQAVRLEFTFRRRALRKLHVDVPDSLGGIDWGAACSRRARLVTVPMEPRRRTALSVAAREAFASGGIFAVRDRLGTSGMRWLSRNIVSSPMQHMLETALSALGDLPADAPQDIAQPDLVDPETVAALLRSVSDASMEMATTLSSEVRLLADKDDLVGRSMGTQTPE